MVEFVSDMHGGGPRLIVSSLERAMAAFEQHRPDFVISILSEDEPRPTFPSLPADRHLRLYVDSECGPAIHDSTARERTRKIIDRFQDWPHTLCAQTILIHCAKGIARSMATAFILLCMAHPEQDETQIARRLRAVAPHADPCLFMVNHADNLLGRECRMFDAIDDLPPCHTTIDAPTIILSAAE